MCSYCFTCLYFAQCRCALLHVSDKHWSDSWLLSPSEDRMSVWRSVTLCDALWRSVTLTPDYRHAESEWGPDVYVTLCDALWRSVTLRDADPWLQACWVRVRTGCLCDALWRSVTLCDAPWRWPLTTGMLSPSEDRMSMWRSVTLCDALWRSVTLTPDYRHAESEWGPDVYVMLCDALWCWPLTTGMLSPSEDRMSMWCSVTLCDALWRSVTLCDTPWHCDTDPWLQACWVRARTGCLCDALWRSVTFCDALWRSVTLRDTVTLTRDYRHAESERGPDASRHWGASGPEGRLERTGEDLGADRRAEGEAVALHPASQGQWSYPHSLILYGCPSSLARSVVVPSLTNSLWLSIQPRKVSGHTLTH